MAPSKQKLDRRGRSKKCPGFRELLDLCFSWQCLWTIVMIWTVCCFYLFISVNLKALCASSAASKLGFRYGTTAARALSGKSVRNKTDRNRDENLAWTSSENVIWSGDLRTLTTPWNRLCYDEKAPGHLRIALFVKKWPVGGIPGGLERHAMTLHGVLASRGHEVHVFTMSGDGTHSEDVHEGNLHLHFVEPNENRGLDINRAWELFATENALKSFDVVHSESVALPHWRAKNLSNIAASWHGIAFEVIHADLVQDLIRKPGESRTAELQKILSQRLLRVVDEARFFHSYKHHIATSDFVSDVLRTIYELPAENVHTILNGVDESRFHPDPSAAAAFRAKHGVPSNASLVLGAAGRLVRDKGHPLLVEAFREILKDHDDVHLLIAGSGPWADRYEALGPNVKTLGVMAPAELGQFYNALDVFVNPTLRSQGLDHTLLEAMQCGKPLLATKFSSITRSVVISRDFGYTFSPNVRALIKALRDVIQDGKANLRQKGESCLEYASFIFSATKMAAAYERLFLCMKHEAYCHYPLPHDCLPPTSKYFQ